MRDLCGPNWLPLEVRFAHRRPASLRPFLESFHTTLRFNAEQSALVFSANWLRRRLPEVDADLRRLLDGQWTNSRRPKEPASWSGCAVCCEPHS